MSSLSDSSLALAMMFPGQGSQSVGMLAELSDAYKQVKETFDEASEILGYDTWALTQQGTKEQLAQTEVTQPLMLVAGVAVWKVWQAMQGPMPKILGGHSLGEYTALVCAESLAFSDALRLVEKRAIYMQEAVTADVGGMAVILGLDVTKVKQVCHEISGRDTLSEIVSYPNFVAVTNLNAPQQIVIGGHREAVADAMQLAKEKGAKKTVWVAMSVPSHCLLVKEAAHRLKPHLDALVFKKPIVSVVNNVNGAVEFDPEKIKHALFEQIYQPVLWVSVVRCMAGKQVSCLLECGPGKVLAGLAKRIVPEIRSISLGSLTGFEQFKEMVMENE